MSSTKKDGIYSLIGKFLHHLKLSNYAPGTIAYTKIYLRDFAFYLEERGLYEIRNLTKDELQKYLHYLTHEYQPQRKKKGQKLADSSVYSRWGRLLLFFNYLTTIGEILYNPALRIDRPRVDFRKGKTPMTLREVNRLLSLPDLGTRTGLRDRAILEVFYATGIRRGELLGLEIFDVDIAESTLRIQKAKGRKERIVPLGEEASYYIAKYLHEARKFLCRDPSQNSLFLTQHGTPVDSGLLQWIVERYVSRSRIKKKVTPHILRHTFSSHMLEGGADIFTIKELLGHVRVETTQIYTNAAIKNLKEVHRNCHPRGKRV